jgi:hypothetical protein
MSEQIGRRSVIAAATIGAIGLANNSLASAAEKESSRPEVKEAGQNYATPLAGVRCFHAVIGWDGTNRRTPASFKVEAPAGTFKTDGVYIQQNPGGGGWHEVGLFKKIVTSDRGIEIAWEETGGQNYNVWLPVDHEVGTSAVNVTKSGPYTIAFSGFVDAPFPT